MGHRARRPLDVSNRTCLPQFASFVSSAPSERQAQKNRCVRLGFNAVQRSWRVPAAENQAGSCSPISLRRKIFVIRFSISK
jgi:hypothetical protein